MPKAKKAETEVSAPKPIAKKNLKAAEMGVPIEEYAARVKASQSPSLEPGLIRSRVSDALEAQGYEPVDIFKVLKSL